MVGHPGTYRPPEKKEWLGRNDQKRLCRSSRKTRLNMNHDKMHSPKLTARLRIAAGLAFVWLLAILTLSGAEWIANFHNIAPGQNKITLLLLKLAEDLIIWLKTYLLILAVYLAASY